MVSNEGAIVMNAVTIQKKSHRINVFLNPKLFDSLDEMKLPTAPPMGSRAFMNPSKEL